MYVRSMSNWTEWYETKHEAIAEGQAMVFRSNREFIQFFLFNSKPEVGSLK